MPLSRPAYHRGNLPRALLEHAEAELEEAGLEGFSLRRVAKRAGVSHAAPAHHFGDTAGLLTALAADGFKRLSELQSDIADRVDGPPCEQLIATGRAYVVFATRHPALFRLMFFSRRPDLASPELKRELDAAFGQLVDRVSAVTGKKPSPARIVALWAFTHGLADLAVGRLSPTLVALTEEHGELAYDIIFRELLAGPPACQSAPAGSKDELTGL